MLERYTAPQDGKFNIRGNWTNDAGGDGVDISIQVNGKQIWQSHLDTRIDLAGLQVNLNAGDKVDFIVSSRGMGGRDHARNIFIEKIDSPTPSFNLRSLSAIAIDIINGRRGTTLITSMLAPTKIP